MCVHHEYGTVRTRTSSFHGIVNVRRNANEEKHFQQIHEILKNSMFIGKIRLQTIIFNYVYILIRMLR